MYAQLTNVLQAVITNKDADIQKLMDTANSNLPEDIRQRIQEELICLSYIETNSVI